MKIINKNKNKKRVFLLACVLFTTLCIVSCGQVKEDEFTKKSGRK